MQRQKSILSFLQRPSPENQKCCGDTPESRRHPKFPSKQQIQDTVVANQPTVASTEDASLEIRGTDTPPEKVPRQIFPASFVVNNNNGKPSTFLTIKHKFVQVDDREKSCDRNQTNGSSINVCPISSKSSILEGLPSEHAAFEHIGKGHVPIEIDRRGDKGNSWLIEDNDDNLGPETPGTRPLVPRLKRIQENSCNFGSRSDCFLLDSSKRMKSLQDSKTGNKNQEELSGTTNKFEWLDPSRIRDANGRRPGDVLYDKRTLYIPPDALKKMSASQKQYWNVKSQYMDLVLFFKVGKFYELYELDAEIGHVELDWKMTFSGVGKCRQVGISESGIDDAVQKLIARG
ncbi:DNA mismatch repair protein msh7 [Sarracenia purpurea var. burkii]